MKLPPRYLVQNQHKPFASRQIAQVPIFWRPLIFVHFARFSDHLDDSRAVRQERTLWWLHRSRTWAQRAKLERTGRANLAFTAKHKRARMLYWFSRLHMANPITIFNIVGAR